MHFKQLLSWVKVPWAKVGTTSAKRQTGWEAQDGFSAENSCSQRAASNTKRELAEWGSQLHFPTMQSKFQKSWFSSWQFKFYIALTLTCGPCGLKPAGEPLRGLGGCQACGALHLRGWETLPWHCSGKRVTFDSGQYLGLWLSLGPILPPACEVPGCGHRKAPVPVITVP